MKVINPKLTKKEIYSKVLFESSSGSNGTITLKDNLSNYDYIEIEYDCNTYGIKTQKVLKPNGKSIILDYVCWATGWIVQLSANRYDLENNKMNNTNKVLTNLDLINNKISGDVSSNIKVLQVVGYIVGGG